MKANSLIFGASKGIGKEIFNHLRKKHNVIGFARNIKNSKNFISLDLSKHEEISKIILSKVKYKYIDNIVFSQRYRGEDMLENFYVSLFSIKKIIETLHTKMTNRGSIVIIISQASDYILNDHDIDYHLIHSALNALTRFYAVKLGPKKIRVNSVSTVTIIKPENKKFYTKKNNIYKLVKKITPLSEMGTSKNISNTVEFLCDNKSSFITGQNINVNGGINLMSHDAMAKKYFLS